MESDAAHARGVIMRDAHNGEDCATRRARLARLARRLRRAGDHRRRHAGAGPPHPRPRARCGAASSPPSCPSRRRASGSPPSRRWRAPTSPAPSLPPSRSRSPATGPHIVAIDTGIKLSIVRQFRERGSRLTLLPCDSSAEEVLAPRSRPGLPRQRPRRPRRARLRGRHGPRRDRQAARVRDLPRPPAASAGRSASRPSSCPSATAAPTTRSRTSRTGRIDITSQNHGFAVAGPGGEQRIEGDEPVRWETDFGAAELSHLNLYDRTVEGLGCCDVDGGTVQYHPEAGPGPHDARYLFDRFMELAA